MSTKAACYFRFESNLSLALDRTVRAKRISDFRNALLTAVLPLAEASPKLREQRKLFTMMT